MDGEWTDPQKQEAFKKTPIHTYSPQCNPVENLWDEIREKWYPNQVFQSLQAVEDTLVETVVTGSTTSFHMHNGVLIIYLIMRALQRQLSRFYLQHV